MVFFFGQVGVNGRLVSVPYVGGDMEVSVYGAITYELRLHRLGHILTFTPQINEFQLQLSPKTFASKMYGLCGKMVFSTLPLLLVETFLHLSSGLLEACVSGSASRVQTPMGAGERLDLWHQCVGASGRQPGLFPCFCRDL